MRIVLLTAAVISLSACSMGGQPNGTYQAPQPQPYMAGDYQAQTPQHIQSNYRTAKFSVEAGVGKEFVAGGTLWDGELENPVVGVTANKIKMKDAFKTGTRYDVGASYALNPRLKISATAYKTKHKGKENLPVASFFGLPEVADVTDYDSYGIEAGLRKYGAPVKTPLVKSIRPYIEARAGAAHVDDISFVNYTIGVAGAFPDQKIYDKGWAPTGAGLIGFETPVFNRFTMGVETGIRYNGKLNSNEMGDTTPGNIYEGANSDGSKWSIPVSLRGRFRF
ncbi:MAG: hypothetical protein ACPGVT_11220 [Maricaulaceae bacterium]